nr:CrcB family protein [Propioniciclava soli]
MPVAAVIAGGALGTALRAALTHAWPPQAEGLPWVTLLINASGALALGTLLGWLGTKPDAGVRRLLRLGLGTGLLGGYTTYSTFVLESVTLAGAGRPGVALVYAAASLVAGYLAAAVGLTLGIRGQRATPRLKGRRRWGPTRWG